MSILDMFVTKQIVSMIPVLYEINQCSYINRTLRFICSEVHDPELKIKLPHVSFL